MRVEESVKLKKSDQTVHITVNLILFYSYFNLTKQKDTAFI